jgi:phosphate transport system ATP-binding protein
MTASPVLAVERLLVRAQGRAILGPLSLSVSKGEILAVIGPAGSGKSTLLRVLTRMTELDEGLSLEGGVSFHGREAAREDVVALRRKVGLVFPVPTPLPLSIYENLAFGPRLLGQPEKDIAARAEVCLRAAYLWEEVKDRMTLPGGSLSGGQQQRLCLARSLMLRPDALLLDEPCSGLDPISTAKIEEALTELKKDMAIVLVTNNVKQASRTSDRTAFLLMSELVECADTADVFTNPRDRRTEDYVTGRFG